MAVSGFMYSNTPNNAFAGNLTDLSVVGTDINVALLAAAHTPNQNTHDNFEDVSGNQVSGTGYTAGGAEITTKSLSTTGRVTTFDGDDVEWTSSTITAQYAVIYDATPALPADQKLIALIDFGEELSSSDGTFKITWHTDGIFAITVAE